MKNEDSPQFIHPKPCNLDFSKEDIWYGKHKIGKNTIGKFLGDAQKMLPRGRSNGSKVANHSARKTCITNLMDQNVNPLHI